MRGPVVFGGHHRREPIIVASASAASLLERERELAQLAALVDAAARGRGGVALVRGPAGIGKTTLLDAARGRAVARELRVLAARAGALERAWAFGLVHGLLGGALDAAERAELLRGAAALAAPFVDPAAEPHAGTDPEFATVHGLYWLCADLAARRPLLLVADDAHWADAPSLRFLVHLARRAGELPLALIVAARPPGPDDHRELLAALAAESGLELAPAPLSAAAVGELARRRLGEHATADLVAACAAASAGNPFLLHAALGALAREPDPAVSTSRAGVPRYREPDAARLASVAGARLAPDLDRRLAALGPGARELARAVSVLGPGASARHARALAGLEVEPAARLLDALAEQEILRAEPLDSVHPLPRAAAHDAEIPCVAPLDSAHPLPRAAVRDAEILGVEPLDFVHPLLRAAVHDAIPAGERGLLHAAAARALAADGAGADRLAPHLLAAPAAGEAWVASALAEAARRALAMGAPELAAGYLRRALAEPPPPDARPALLGDLGAAEARLGRPEGLERLREARDATPPGPDRARRGRALAWALVAPGRYREAAEALVEAAADARADRELALTLAADLATVRRLAPEARTGERRDPPTAPAGERPDPPTTAAGERTDPPTAAGECPEPLTAAAGELPRVEGASPAERVVVASLAMHHVLLADDAATAAGLAARALAGGL
ncbi:MAG TPA: ATP-binding protein, partial [Solirubrobacteraceae bacterium]